MFTSNLPVLSFDPIFRYERDTNGGRKAMAPYLSKNRDISIDVTIIHPMSILSK